MSYFLIFFLICSLITSTHGLSSFQVRLSLSPTSNLFNEPHTLCRSVEEFTSQPLLEKHDEFIFEVDSSLFYDSAVITISLSEELSPSVLNDVLLAFNKKDLRFSNSSDLPNHGYLFHLSDFEKTSHIVTEKGANDEPILNSEMLRGSIYYYFITFSPCKISHLCFGCSKEYHHHVSHKIEESLPLSRRSVLSSINSSNSTSSDSRKNNGGMSIIAIVSVAVVAPLAFLFLSVVFYTTIKYFRSMLKCVLLYISYFSF
jgi:hypothetical protein